MLTVHMNIIANNAIVTNRATEESIRPILPFGDKVISPPFDKRARIIPMAAHGMAAYMHGEVRNAAIDRAIEAVSKPFERFFILNLPF